MEQKRLIEAQQKEEKIVMRLFEKQNRLLLDSTETRSNLTSMQSSARLWRGIAKADRDQNMLRNKEVQKAYKQKLIEDLIQKEQKV